MITSIGMIKGQIDISNDFIIQNFMKYVFSWPLSAKITFFKLTQY